jgi:hypothetical protein
MLQRPIMIVTILSSAICCAGFALGADDQHTLIKSLGSAKVSLQQGLAAAQPQGTAVIVLPPKTVRRLTKALASSCLPVSIVRHHSPTPHSL